MFKFGMIRKLNNPPRGQNTLFLREIILLEILYRKTISRQRLKKWAYPITYKLYMPSN